MLSSITSNKRKRSLIDEESMCEYGLRGELPVILSVLDNFSQSLYESALDGLAQSGSIELYDLLHDKCGSMRKIDHHSLFAAASAGRIEMIQHIMRKHSLKTNEDWNQVLLGGSKAGCIELVVLALQHGANDLQGACLEILHSVGDQLSLVECQELVNEYSSDEITIQDLLLNAHLGGNTCQLDTALKSDEIAMTDTFQQAVKSGYKQVIRHLLTMRGKC